MLKYSFNLLGEYSEWLEIFSIFCIYLPKVMYISIGIQTDSYKNGNIF